MEMTINYRENDNIVCTAVVRGNVKECIKVLKQLKEL